MPNVKKWLRAGAALLGGASITLCNKTDCAATPLPATPTILLASSSLAIITFSGYDHFRAGIIELKTTGAKLGMDALVSLSCSSCWLFSVAILIFPEIFPEAAAHMGFFSPALYTLFALNLSSIIKHKIHDCIGDQQDLTLKRLQDRQPPKVTTTEEGILDLQDVQKGKAIVCRAGQTIPIDGKVLSGSASITELELITGEPSTKVTTLGGEIYAGTRVSNGEINIITSCSGGNSLLNQITRAIQSPSHEIQPPHENTIQLVVHYFVPTIIVFSLLSFMTLLTFTHHQGIAFQAAVNVLLSACPCTLLLAPTSYSMARYAAIKQNFIVRDEAALAFLAKTTYFVTDRTGTLTHTRVHSMQLFAEELSEPQLMQYISSLEAMTVGRKHPFAQAILDNAKLKRLTLLDAEITSVSHNGICGQVAGHTIHIGNEHFIQAATESIPKLGMTTNTEAIHIAVDGQYAATLFFIHDLKPDAKQLIQWLHSKNIPVIMLSGGSSDQTQHTAKQLGIEVYGEGESQNPTNKAGIIAELQAQGHTVCYLGDGDNDVLAAQTADVSIAVDTKCNLSNANISARGQLSDIIILHELATAMMRNIYTNYAIAMSYNTAMVIASGFVMPLNHVAASTDIAGISMATSSALVTANAARLTLFEPKPKKEQPELEVPLLEDAAANC